MLTDVDWNSVAFHCLGHVHFFIQKGIFFNTFLVSLTSERIPPIKGETKAFLLPATSLNEKASQDTYSIVGTMVNAVVLFTACLPREQLTKQEAHTM